MPVDIWPIIINTGPIAAANPAAITIDVCIEGLKLLNQVTKLFIQATKSLTIGNKASPILIAAPSKALFKVVICPLKLSFIVAAISDAAPFELYNSLVKFSILSDPVFIRIPIAFILSAVKVLWSATIFSDSLSPSVAFCTPATISAMLLKLPFASVIFTLVSPIAIAPSFILLDISLNTAFNAVPASLPLSPWSPSLPSNAVVCSISNPKELALTAQFLKASPSAWVVVLELAWAYANTSDILPAWSASSWNALK